MASATDTVRPERTKAPRARSTQRLDDLVGESPLRVRSPESSAARRRGHVKWRHVFPSRLTTRLLAVNLLALAIVAGGVFYLDQYERGLTEERISAMVTQADIVAAALGETAVPHDPMLPQAMDPALGRKLLARLVRPIQTRARLYDQNGRLVADSRRLAAGGTQVRWYELGPPRSPGLLDTLFDDLNAYLERFFRSLKSECLDRMIFFGERSLRNAVREYLAHFHGERNHQGLGNTIIEPGDEVGQTDGEVECRERLGGMLRYYHRHAA